MVALTADRNARRREGDLRSSLVAANARIYTGALLMRNAAGYVLPGATATGGVGVGVALVGSDNTGGAAGAKSVTWRAGTYVFANSSAGDAITIAEIGDVAWIVDDQTVARTNGSATRSPAGIIEDVDASGVWVRLDEALTKAS